MRRPIIAAQLNIWQTSEMTSSWPEGNKKTCRNFLAVRGASNLRKLPLVWSSALDLWSKNGLFDEHRLKFGGQQALNGLLIAHKKCRKAFLVELWLNLTVCCGNGQVWKPFELSVLVWPIIPAVRKTEFKLEVYLVHSIHYLTSSSLFKNLRPIPIKLFVEKPASSKTTDNFCLTVSQKLTENNQLHLCVNKLM